MTQYKSDDDIFVLFAHANYQLDIGFKKLKPPQKSMQIYNYNDLLSNISNADVLVISGLWQNELIDKAKNLKYIQLTGVGYDGYDLNELKNNNIKLCNAVGLNRIVVAEHTISLILSLSTVKSAKPPSSKYCLKTNSEFRLILKTLFFIELSALDNAYSEPSIP